MSCRIITYVSLALIATYAIWRFAVPFLETHPEQDTCSFGLVSNETFRLLLEEANSRARTSWPALRGTREEQQRLLQARIADLSSKRPVRDAAEIFERIAATHAVMRQLKAFLFVPEEPTFIMSTSTPFDRAMRSYNYAINSFQVGTFDLFDRYSVIGVGTRFGPNHSQNSDFSAGQSYYVKIYYAGSIGRWTGLGMSSPLYYDRRAEPERRSRLCPPVPTAESALAYERWLQDRKEK